MTYTVEALGDFMRVGPQVYPERPNAVQVIMRGPHGKRLAADPVRTREGRARGSGFRTWIEQLNVPANESWNPPQKVVGLLGITDTLSTAADYATMGPARRWLVDKLVASGAVDPRGGRAGGTAFDSTQNQTKGDLPATDKAARTQVVLAFKAESERTPPRYSDDESRAMENQLRSLLMSSRWTDSGVAPNGTFMSQPDLLGILNVVNRDRASRGVREDGAPMYAPGAFDRKTGRARRDDPREAARRSLRDDLAPDPPSGGAVAGSLVAVGLFAAAGFALYALASGYGKGLATRRFTPPPKET